MSGTAFDLAVIGAGMAGGVVASEAAAQGLRVVLIEAGAARFREEVPARSFSDRLAGLGMPGRWPHPISQADARGRSKRLSPVQGFGAGGSATLYGAALARFRRSDFEQDDSATTGEADALPTRWPFGLDEIRPYYAEIERRFGICGTCDPLDADDDAHLRPPPPMTRVDAALAETLRGKGLHPFRLHMGLDYRTGCSECQGTPCTRDCKADSYNRLVETCPARDRIDERFDHMVTQIAPGADGGYVVSCQTREGNCEIAATRVVLAAGALQSPLVLMRSPALWPGAPPALLGRGLMFHVTDIIAVSTGHKGAASGQRKTLALRDFYRIDDRPGGEVQSFGFVPSAGLVSRYLQSEALRLGLGWLGPALVLLRIPAAIGARRYGDASLFATITEDMPYSENRVVPEGDGFAMAIRYSVRPELRKRCQRLRDAVTGAFAPARVAFLSQLAKFNLGHPMGTCRMGADPETSVVDDSGAVRGCPGLYVADASVFPSSGGANPGLTVAALALRITRKMLAAQDDGKAA